MRASLPSSVFVVSLLLPALAWSEAVEGVRPLREIEAYARSRSGARGGPERVLPPSEEVQQLAHARVAIANYEAIRRDFFPGRTIGDAAIDRWLLDQVAYVSTPQTQQSIFNEGIALSGKTRRAYRPASYGRGLVFEVFDPQNPQKKLGLIDAKGNGLRGRVRRKNNDCDHCNGLLALGEALREYSYERMVNAVQKHARSQRTTVNSYAVISTGFSIKQSDGSRVPAAIYLRQAHRRATANAGDLGRQRVLLEHYGIDGGFAVQGTPEGHLVDFGNYVGMPSKTRYALPLAQWGAPLKHDPQWDNPWKWGHETAAAFAAGRATRHHVWLYYRSLLEPLEGRLQATPQTDFVWAQAEADPMRALIHQIAAQRAKVTRQKAPPAGLQHLRAQSGRRGGPRSFR